MRTGALVVGVVWAAFACSACRDHHASSWPTASDLLPPSPSGERAPSADLSGEATPGIGCVDGAPSPSEEPGELVFEPPHGSASIATHGTLGIFDGHAYWMVQDLGGFPTVVHGALDDPACGYPLALEYGSHALHVSDSFVVYAGDDIRVITANDTPSLRVAPNPYEPYYGTVAPCTFAVDRENVYCAGNEEIRAWPTAEAAPSRTIASRVGWMNGFVADDEFLYFDGGGSIRRLPKSGGNPATAEIILVTSVSSMVLRGGRLFWTSARTPWGEDERRAVLVSDAKPGASTATLINETPRLGDIAVDPFAPEDLYAAVDGPGGGIVRARATGGELVTVVRGLTSIANIAVDRTHVYWTSREGRLYRHPKP
jgi:hypothetical protein